MLRRVVAWSLGLVLLGVVPGEARSPQRAKCFPPKATELLRSKQTRVYLDRRGLDTTVACNYATGRQRFLGADDEGIYVERPPALDLAGSLVGYAFYDGSDPTAYTYSAVRVLDVRTGRVLNESPTDTPGRGAVRSLQIGPQGEIAWIQGGEVYAAVWKSAPNAVPVRLDEGADMHLRSLSLRGNTLAWVRGGERHRAELR